MTPDSLEEIRAEAVRALEQAGDSESLDQVRVEFLGRKGRLTEVLRGLSSLPEGERAAAGERANKVRAELEQAISERGGELEGAEMARTIEESVVDVTLPGSPRTPSGHLHPITSTRREIEDVMVGLGYQVLDGPEVELDYYNFTALNHPDGHPARMVQDTFYVAPGSLARAVDDEVLLRTHTSPMQVRAMETHPPPLFVLVPGKVYRRDSDATHSPMFHQVEGLAVADGLTLADLRGTLLELLRAVFGQERDLRMRPHFFPFTEPSVEFDVSCFACNGSGRLPDGARDPLCKGIGWIEVGGAGMVDPEVFGFVADAGYDAERIQGFAFGMGIERIAMLKHGMGDLRRLFDGDVRVLEQFS